MNYIVDIILCLIFVLSIVLAYKKGFFPTVFDFGGKILAFVSAHLLSKAFAPQIYDSYLSAGIKERLTLSLGDVSTTDVGAQIESALSSIPQSLDGLISAIGIDKAALIEKVNSLELTGENLIDTLMTSVVSPVVTAVCRAILFMVLFFVLALIVRVVLGLVSKLIKKLPVLKQSDKLLGIVIGALRGALLVFVAAIAVAFIAGLTKNTAFIDAVAGSKLVQLSDSLLQSVSGYSA